MPKVMLINVTHSEESRVAILSDGVLEAFEIESLSREHLKGNVYKGIVRRIHPALEAAFVDIGADRDAFLPIDEICFRNLPVSLGTENPPERGNGRRVRIRDILRSGNQILVQITKEAFGNKPPTLTTFYSLPGRYLVLLPGSEDQGISRRIEGEERQRLREHLAALDVPEGFGVIARTAAGFDEDVRELQHDLQYLLRLWENIRRAAEQSPAPALVYREHDIVLRTIRDYLTPDIDEVYVDDEEVFERARAFAREILPGREGIIRLYRGAQPIFSAFNIESQIETIFKRRVPLPSGGSIAIDPTEALTAIDVNSGGSVRGPNPEETAYRTNIEAAREIARQLRLRDIGGLIVIDFIDMREPSHIHEVEQEMRRAMHHDKARHEISRISRFGLMQISRQRLRPAAASASYVSCPMCEGHGAVRTTESAALLALRKIHNRISHGDVQALTARVPNAVAIYLLNQKRSDLATLEQRYQTRILIEPRDDLMPHQLELDIHTRAPALEASTASQVATNGAASAQAGGKKRRRRGGRGRKRRAALAMIEALRSIAVRAGIIPAPDAGEAEQPQPEAAKPVAAPENGFAAGGRRTVENAPGREEPVPRADEHPPAREAGPEQPPATQTGERAEPDAAPVPADATAEPTMEEPAVATGEPATREEGIAAQPPSQPEDAPSEKPARKRRPARTAAGAARKSPSRKAATAKAQPGPEQTAGQATARTGGKTARAGRRRSSAKGSDAGTEASTPAARRTSSAAKSSKGGSSSTSRGRKKKSAAGPPQGEAAPESTQRATPGRRTRKRTAKTPEEPRGAPEGDPSGADEKKSRRRTSRRSTGRKRSSPGDPAAKPDDNNVRETAG